MSNVGLVDPVEAVAAEVERWEGVARAPHRFGGVELLLGRRELGHVHRDGVVDLPFPRRIGAMLVETGRAERHHHLPGSGWVTFRIREPADVDAAVELFRLSYERARVAHAAREARGG
jgi:hypothetical protein